MTAEDASFLKILALTTPFFVIFFKFEFLIFFSNSAVCLLVMDYFMVETLRELKDNLFEYFLANRVPNFF